MEIDTDGNGTIDFHEFVAMMKKKSSEKDQLAVRKLSKNILSNKHPRTSKKRSECLTKTTTGSLTWWSCGR